MPQRGQEPARLALALALTAALTGITATACAPRRARPPAVATRDIDVVLDALAARERGLQVLRVSMRVRALNGGMLSSPAYLAMDGPDAISLQVLSPFGMTLLDLKITGERYELRLPMRGEVRRGTVDPAAIAVPDAAPDERMIVALALLFRPKFDRSQCRGNDGAADQDELIEITCRLAAQVVVHVAVDGALHPIRERYTRDDGSPILSADYADYGNGNPALPERIVVRDAAGTAGMVARVLRARVGAVRNRP